MSKPQAVLLRKSVMRYRMLFSCLFFISAVQAQEDEAPSGSPQQKGYVAFNYDNDFFNATDRYFTQGIRLEWMAPFFRKSPVSKLLPRLRTDGAYTQYGISAEQQCFTPLSIRRDTVFTGERPYAAVMFLSHVKKTMDVQNQQALTAQMDLGILGPCAVCEQEQKGIHKALDNIEPLGWEFQLSTDVVANYTLMYEKGFYTRKHFALLGSGQLRAGTLYTDLSTGFTLRTGWMPDYFAAPLRKQPFRLYAFFKGNIKAVAYNATLQGGLFNRDNIYTLPSKSIARLVGTGVGGIVLAYKRLSVEYTRIFITPEFDNGIGHGWGHCNIGFSF